MTDRLIGRGLPREVRYTGRRMRRGFLVRAATLLLALLVPLAGVRAAAVACCVDSDCDQPCCDRDADNTTVRPVLPCCRAVALNQTAAHPTPTTVENDQHPPAVPELVVAPVVALTRSDVSSARSLQHLPAPPLYHQHCALLL